MKINKSTTETYVISDLSDLDPVTVYVTNYSKGKGKIVIECFGDAWAYYWGDMAGKSLQEFFVSCDNDYILDKLLANATQTDFKKINDIAKEKGFQFCVSNEFEMGIYCNEIAECFGIDWPMDMPICKTNEYNHLNRIIEVIKKSFTREAELVVSSN